MVRTTSETLREMCRSITKGPARTRHILEVPIQLDFPTMMTPSCIHLLCFDFVCWSEKVSDLTNHPEAESRNSARGSRYIQKLFLVNRESESYRQGGPKVTKNRFFFPCSKSRNAGTRRRYSRPYGLRGTPDRTYVGLG
jgi:hypothetical protein